MNIKIFAITLSMTSLGVSAQPKVFMFEDVLRRDDKQYWVSHLKGDEDCVAYFSDDEIVMNVDKLYHLQILSTTHLPDEGLVYLCKDETGQAVTITLIGNERMFFYDEKKRFLINFKPSAKTVTTQPAFANAED